MNSFICYHVVVFHSRKLIVSRITLIFNLQRALRCSILLQANVPIICIIIARSVNALLQVEVISVWDGATQATGRISIDSVACSAQAVSIYFCARARTHYTIWSWCIHTASAVRVYIAKYVQKVASCMIFTEAAIGMHALFIPNTRRTWMDEWAAAPAQWGGCAHRELQKVCHRISLE